MRQAICVRAFRFTSFDAESARKLATTQVGRSKKLSSSEAAARIDELTAKYEQLFEKDHLVGILECYVSDEMITLVCDHSHLPRFERDDAGELTTKVSEFVLTPSIDEWLKSELNSLTAGSSLCKFFLTESDLQAIADNYKYVSFEQVLDLIRKNMLVTFAVELRAAGTVYGKNSEVIKQNHFAVELADLDIERNPDAKPFKFSRKHIPNAPSQKDILFKERKTEMQLVAAEGVTVSDTEVLESLKSTHPSIFR